MKSQPRAIYLLAFTQAWESFSYYGMRALLVLYLISALKYQEGDAFAIYALYTCLIEFGAFLGGYLADRFIGLKKAVLLGGGLICIGHALLTFADSEWLFFYGLSCIICGAMLFRSNLKAMVGLLYEGKDPGREAGFTLLYMGINFGGFAAVIACSYVAEVYGWHAGFGLASLGMVIGMGIFSFTQSVEEKSSGNLLYALPVIMLGLGGTAYALAHAHFAQGVILPVGICLFAGLMVKLGQEIEKHQILMLLGILACLVLYFTFDELMGSLLMVYLENKVDRQMLGWEVPSAMITAVNPLVIIGFGPLLSGMLQKRQVGLLKRLGIAFLFLGTAFSILYLGQTTALHVMISFSCIALGELFLAPAVYAYCSLIAPENQKGLTMGIVTLAFSIASLLSGGISQMATLDISGLFLAVAVLSFVVFAGLFFYPQSSLKQGFAE